MKQKAIAGAVFGLFVVMLMLAPALYARTCTGPADVQGAYGFAASRSYFVAGTSGGTGTDTGTGTSTKRIVAGQGGGTGSETTSSQTTSSTGGTFGGINNGITTGANGITNLVNAASATAPYGSIGRVLFDGAGVVSAYTSPSTTASENVGIYKVNSDCSISINFYDAFTPPGSNSTTGSGTTSSTGPATGATTGRVTTDTPSGTFNSVTYEGVIVDAGNEIDLVQTGSGQGSAIKMKRLLQTGACQLNTVNGSFGLFGTGVAVVPPGTAGNGTVLSTAATTSADVTALTLVGRVTADGNGNFVLDSPGSASPLTQREFTGTYTLTPDCTGTASVSGMDSSGKPTNTRALNFVLVSQTGQTGGRPALPQPEILFTFADPDVSGIGEGKQQ